jgi:hypothetical protein
MVMLQIGKAKDLSAPLRTLRRYVVQLLTTSQNELLLAAPSTSLDSTLILKTEAIRYSETSVDFYRTIRRHIPVSKHDNIKTTDECKTATKRFLYSTERNHVRLYP